MVERSIGVNWPRSSSSKASRTRCMLVGDLNDEDEQLRPVMERLDVELVELNRLDIDWTSQNVSPPIDFVCAILGQPEAPNVETAMFVDIGVALGRAIPVILVVEPRRAVPLALDRLTRVEADLDNGPALELHLKQFLRAIRRGVPRSAEGRAGNPTLSREQAAKAQEALRGLRHTERGGVSGDFEWLMADLLRGDAQISTPVSRDEGADLALLGPENQLAVGGPVLVQMKVWDTLTNRGLADARDRFAQHVRRTTAPFGLLIYHVLGGVMPQQPSKESESRVIVVSANDLIEMLAARPLSSVLATMRNAVVHGAAYRG
ncbi:hypothetical protein [Nocardia blacklockiae]|uniref:hypothetical protein n=1 Tax=Nocardia blacklockiae TaxID=480036 RepID=UPI001893B31E|nr:hypothetical protein [Nocardia blacklockiae]MBF6176805.1 hypothetical protein [Nocardia blacklockiae]